MKLKDWLMLKLCSRAEDIHTIVDETRNLVKELSMKTAELRAMFAAFVITSQKVAAEYQASIDEANAKQAELSAKIQELVDKGDEVDPELVTLAGELGTILTDMDTKRVDVPIPTDPATGDPVVDPTTPADPSATDVGGTDTLTADPRV